MILQLLPTPSEGLLPHLSFTRFPRETICCMRSVYSALAKKPRTMPYCTIQFIWQYRVPNPLHCAQIKDDTRLHRAYTIAHSYVEREIGYRILAKETACKNIRVCVVLKLQRLCFYHALRALSYSLICCISGSVHLLLRRELEQLVAAIAALCFVTALLTATCNQA